MHTDLRSLDERPAFDTIEDIDYTVMNFIETKNSLFILVAMTAVETCPEILIDRDWSWLDFNQRVLAEALDERNPLLERAKFLAIFTSNLDEFFMKRATVLREPLPPGKLLPMLEAQARCFREQIVPALARHSVHLRHWEDLTPAQRGEANEFFDRQVSPALTPLVINSAENFPFLSNLSTSLVFPLDDPASGQRLHARVKVPNGVRQWVQLHSETG